MLELPLEKHKRMIRTYQDNDLQRGLRISIRHGSAGLSSQPSKSLLSSPLCLLLRSVSEIRYRIEAVLDFYAAALPLCNVQLNLPS